jgi:transposase
MAVNTTKNQHSSAFDLGRPETLHGLDEDTLIGIISRLYDQNLLLSEKLQAWIKEKYGPKTEKFIDPNQLRLLLSEAQTAEGISSSQEKSEPIENDAKKHKTKQKGHGRKPMPTHLPHVKVRSSELAPDDLICSCCGKQLVKVNEVIRNSHYQFNPSSTYIEDTVEDVFACADCEDTLVSASCAVGLMPEESLDNEPAKIHGIILAEPAAQPTEIAKTAPDNNNDEVLAAAIAAAAAIKRGNAGAGMLAHVIVCKYCDHIPLYRQEQIFAREGADISRSTMCGWLANSVTLLRPLYVLMHSELLQSKIIWTDDTPVKVQDRLKKKKIKIGRTWVYIGDKEHPVNLFDYTDGRGRAGPLRFLRGFTGFLQGDCFSGNEAICTEGGATHVACRAHSRRYFKKAEPNNKAACEEALRMYSELFEIEKTAKDLELNSQQVKQMREQEAVPILDRLKTWLDKQSLTALPKSSFGKAVSYSLNNWKALCMYLADGDLTIDNNIAEREMKHIAIGRKNWYFYGSDNGGERAEVLLSLVSTCKRHGVEPWYYLNDVINRLTKNPHTDLRELLPYNWKVNNPDLEATLSPSQKMFSAAPLKNQKI